MEVSGEFREAMLSPMGAAVIMAGSGSDDSHMEKIGEYLKKLGMPYDKRVCSAHKQPGKLESIIGELNSVPGSVVVIAVAGGTDALSGTVSFLGLYPVISCPPDPPNSSCWTNPPGSSSLYIPNPENVGDFIRQMRSSENPRFVIMADANDEKYVGEIGKSLEGYGISWREETVLGTVPFEGSESVVLLPIEHSETFSNIRDSLSENYPVISCFSDSTLFRPAGLSSDAYIRNPKNAARFIAQAYVGTDPRIRGLLEKEIATKIGSLNESDSSLQIYGGGE